MNLSSKNIFEHLVKNVDNIKKLYFLKELITIQFINGTNMKNYYSSFKSGKNIAYYQDFSRKSSKSNVDKNIKSLESLDAKLKDLQQELHSLAQLLINR